MSEKGEIYTAGKNFTLPPAVTGWTNSTSAPPLSLFYLCSPGSFHNVWSPNWQKRYISCYQRSTRTLWVSSLLWVFMKYLKYLATMGMLSIHNCCQSLSWAGLNIMNISKWWQNDDRKFWWVLVGETNSGSHWHSVSPTRLQLGSAQIWVAPLPNQIDGGGKF